MSWVPLAAGFLAGALVVALLVAIALGWLLRPTVEVLAHWEEGG